MKKLFKSVKEKTFANPVLSTVFLSPYYALRTSPLITSFLDRKGIALMKKYPPSFGSIEERIVKDISQNGIAFTSLDELFPGQELLPKLRAVEEAFAGEARVGRKKSFLMYLWDINSPVDFENPFINCTRAKSARPCVQLYRPLPEIQVFFL